MTVNLCFTIVLILLSTCDCKLRNYQENKHTDVNDYWESPLCGDKRMNLGYTCYCGNTSLSGVDLSNGDTYCCVTPSTSEQFQCKQSDGFHDGLSDVRCKNGQVKHKTHPCNQQCWNSYSRSEKLYKTASLYCQEEEYCLPLEQMGNGVCKAEEDLCNPDQLRCVGDGYVWDDYKVQIKTLGTKLGKDHHYCFKQVNNDFEYDYISREDEEKVLGKHQPMVNYEGLKKCRKLGTDGISCKDKCYIDWCSGTGDVCETFHGIVSLDNPELCRNHSYWKKNNFSCDRYDSDGLLAGIGQRCSGVKQHCFWPWYSRWNADLFYFSGSPNTCVDKSDQVFPIRKTCKQFNEEFLNTYRKLWCRSRNVNDHGKYCDNLENWYSKQDYSKIRDPHGCEKSCKIGTEGAACLACEHPDFFHCNTTGVCIHKTNVCDGHPHPSCGGDDEGIDHCYQEYYKRRIVKRYATLICASKMYPGR